MNYTYVWKYFEIFSVQLNEFVKEKTSKVTLLVCKLIIITFATENKENCA